MSYIPPTPDHPAAVELDAAPSVRDAVERLVANTAARVGRELRDALTEYRIEQVDWTDVAQAVRLN